MNSPSVDLAICDHATFDVHYLRAFARRLPFFFRPALDRSPFGIDDVVQAVNAKLFLQDKTSPASPYVMQNARLVRTHIAYMLADEMLCAHTGQRDLAESSLHLRHQLKRITRDRQMVVAFNTHPLYHYYKAQEGLSMADKPIKVIAATRQDQAIAEWVRDYPVETLVEERLPELLSLDPDCRVIRYATATRRELKATFDRGEPLEPRLREELCQKLFDEWVFMTSLKDLTPTCKLEAELGTDINGHCLIETIQAIASVCEKDEKSFCRYLPLLEEVVLKQVLEGDEDLAGIEAVGRLLQKYDNAVCDFPALGITQLAYKIRFCDLRDIISSL